MSLCLLALFFFVFFCCCMLVELLLFPCAVNPSFSVLFVVLVWVVVCVAGLFVSLFVLFVSVCCCCGCFVRCDSCLV